MDNPFQIIDQRLENIEKCLMELISHSSTSTRQAITTTQDKENVLNVDQLAKYLGCVKSTVMRYKRDGTIPFYQAGRTSYFKKGEVDTALSCNKRKRK